MDFCKHFKMKSKTNEKWRRKMETKSFQSKKKRSKENSWKLKGESES